jgi:hypothetical protein
MTSTEIIYYTCDTCDICDNGDYRVIKYLEDINKYDTQECNYYPNDPYYLYDPYDLYDNFTYEKNLHYLYDYNERLLLKKVIKNIIKKIVDKKMKSLCRGVSEMIMIEIRNEYDIMYYVEYLEKLKYALGNYIKDTNKGTHNALKKTITDIKKFLKCKKLI